MQVYTMNICDGLNVKWSYFKSSISKEGGILNRIIFDSVSRFALLIFRVNAMFHEAPLKMYYCLNLKFCEHAVIHLLCARSLFFCWDCLESLIETSANPIYSSAGDTPSSSASLPSPLLLLTAFSNIYRLSRLYTSSPCLPEINSKKTQVCFSPLSWVFLLWGFE